MLYNQLESLLHPFFMSRGGMTLAGKDMIQNYINLVIQDIWNEFQWLFKFHTEKITTYKIEGGRKVFVSSFDIDSFTEAIDKNGNKLWPTIGIIKDRFDFNYSGKNIFFREDSDVTEIEITYMRTFVWYNSAINGKDELPLPNKFVPPLVKLVYDYASPISLFDGEQTTIDFYGHFKARIEGMKSLDFVSDVIQFIPPKIYN